jgi:hypothetical protein
MPLRNILIAVPTMGGVMKSRTASCLVNLMKRLTRAGVNAEFLNIDSSDIVYARNFYASVVVKSRKLDGLLFIDSDMHFRPELIIKMLAMEEDATSAAYPKRHFDPEGFGKALTKHGDVEKAYSQSSDFTVIPRWDDPRPRNMRLKRGFALMAATGMGCTLLSRKCLLDMIEAGAVDKRVDILNGKRQESWTFFDLVKVDDITLSEDFSFWRRWTHDMKRELWVCINEQVEHIGEFRYTARYIDTLNVRPVSAPDAPTPEAVPEAAAE